MQQNILIMILDNRVKKQAAFYMLVKFVDENNGSITVNTDKVKRVFNDENEYVRIEYMSGEIGLLADADFETMNDAVLKWQSIHPK